LKAGNLPTAAANAADLAIRARLAVRDFFEKILDIEDDTLV